MKVAIIGANGFIGSRAVESFHLGGGPSVVAISRNPSRCVLAARFAVDIRAADALEAESLAAAMQGCTAAVHAAKGEASQLKRLAATLCKAAAKAGVKRLVYLSSADVHGRNPAPGTDEQTRTSSADLDEYATAQLAAEKQFFTDCRKLGIVGHTLRPGIVYGPRSPFVAEVINELRDRRATLVRQGEGVFNSIYVDNLVAAIRLCLKSRNGAGQAYLVGDAEKVTWRDFYHAIARELDLSTQGIRSAEPTRSGEAEASAQAPRSVNQESEWKPTFQHASKHLGYSPVVSFSDGIHRTCAWWRYAQGDFFAAA